MAAEALSVSQNILNDLVPVQDLIIKFQDMVNFPPVAASHLTIERLQTLLDGMRQQEARAIGVIRRLGVVDVPRPIPVFTLKSVKLER